MANLVTKSNTKIVLIAFLVLSFISILSFVFFKLNLGVDYMDATVVSVQLDHEDTLINMEPKISKYRLVSKIEKEGTSNFYFYFQNISKDDTAKLIENIKKDIGGVISAGSFDYYAARERGLIQRAEIISGFGIVAYSLYLFFNFKNKKFTRKEVISIWFSDLLLILVQLILLMGFVSILGKTGVIMDNNFWSIMFLSVGILMIYRIYEVLKARMILKTLETEGVLDMYRKMINTYWPEFVFISCFLAIFSFLPLTVLGIGLLESSVMVLYAIIISLAGTIYLKPFLLNELLMISETKAFKKISFLSKKW